MTLEQTGTHPLITTDAEGRPSASDASTEFSAGDCVLLRYALTDRFGTR